MKSYTDLPQSKRLAEFLPLESADMTCIGTEFVPYPYCESKFKGEDNVYPTWSLAALLNILESEIDGEEGETYQLNIEKDGTWWNVWYREEYDEANPIETESTEDLVDACVNMIVKLKERELL